ncbi:unnamed protein product [Trichobilharzia szidati]|nr:unnamed protein product [Trichobilharzia szidati]
MSHEIEDLQAKTDKLVEEAAKTGLQVNTEVMKITKQQQQQQQHPAPITINERDLKEVTSFTYLGSIVSTTGGTDEDVKSRIGKARNTFINLKPIWKYSSLSINNKIRIFNTNVKSVLLYGSETWRVTKSIFNRLQTFINNRLRSILKIRWPERITNKKLWGQTKQEPIAQQICRRKWRWIGHSLGRPLGDITRQALEWNPKGKRRVGRPRVTWGRSCGEELKQHGLTWMQVKKYNRSQKQVEACS